MRKDLFWTIIIISAMILGYWFYAGIGIWRSNSDISLKDFDVGGKYADWYADWFTDLDVSKDFIVGHRCVSTNNQELEACQQWKKLYSDLEIIDQRESLEQLMLIEGNTLVGVGVPVFIQTRTLGYRILTAYNAVEEQCDSEPCISASGMNVCETTKKIVATNELPFGTELLIDGEIWEVQDKTNARYSHRIDLLMDSYEDAINFGRQIKLVEIIK